MSLTTDPPRPDDLAFDRWSSADLHRESRLFSTLTSSLPSSVTPCVLLWDSEEGTRGCHISLGVTLD